MPKHRVLRHEVTQPPDKSYKIIPLNHGMNALVDSDDFYWLNQWKWRANPSGKRFYAIRTEGNRRVFMHKEILGVIFKCDCDHVNGNSLDNRKQNLRHCTRSQNLCNRGKQENNTSGYKGVSIDHETARYKRPFLAGIIANKKRYYIGRFATAEQAARAYDEFAKKLHGKFARLNFS